MYLCKDMEKKMGCRIAVCSTVCEKCGGRDSDKQLRAAIKFALRDYKSSAELYRKVYKGNRRRIVQLAIKHNISISDILINLARGASNGVPKQEILDIVEEFKLIEE